MSMRGLRGPTQPVCPPPPRLFAPVLWGRGVNERPEWFDATCLPRPPPHPRASLPQYFETASLKDSSDGIRAFEAQESKRAPKPAAAPPSALATATPGGQTTELVRVEFARQTGEARVAVWDGTERPTLLELAERNGLSPPYGCRAGVCGTCAVRVLKGQVEYVVEPLAETADGDQRLGCCAVPKPGCGELVLDW